MIQFAAAAQLAPLAGELVKALAGAVEDPNNYKRLDALRAFVSKVTGKEINKAAFLTFMEETTQGEAYTGVWEQIGEDGTRRLRVEGGWIFDVGHGNPIHVADR